MEVLSGSTKLYYGAAEIDSPARLHIRSQRQMSHHAVGLGAATVLSIILLFPSATLEQWCTPTQTLPHLIPQRAAQWLRAVPARPMPWSRWQDGSRWASYLQTTDIHGPPLPTTADFIATAANIPVDDPQQSRGWKFFRSLGSPRVWLAPMVDASELPFRLLCRRYGVDAAYTPMMHSRIFTEVARYRKDSFSTCPEDRPLLAQFCANDPDVLVKAAAMVQRNCSGIDLNLGCPQRIARSGYYGAFLMDNITLIESIVRKAIQELEVPVTVKIRVFPDDEQTLDYVRRLRDAGAYMIGVHGRTIDQKSPRMQRANWDIIRKVVKEVPDVPIIANGNIRHREDVEDCLQYTGAAAVMSAQSLLDDPAALVLADDPIHRRPDKPALLMAEYLDLVEKYTVPLQMVHGHMHSALGEWLAEFTDVREDLNRIPKKKKRIKVATVLHAYRDVVQKVQQRILEVYANENRTYPIPKYNEPLQPRDPGANFGAFARAHLDPRQSSSWEPLSESTLNAAPAIVPLQALSGLATEPSPILDESDASSESDDPMET